MSWKVTSVDYLYNSGSIGIPSGRFVVYISNGKRTINYDGFETEAEAERQAAVIVNALNAQIFADAFNEAVDRAVSNTFKIGEKALRLNLNYPDEPQQWIEFTVNKAYLALISEFPDHYKKLENKPEFMPTDMPRLNGWEVIINEQGVQMAVVNRDELVNYIKQVESIPQQHYNGLPTDEEIENGVMDGYEMNEKNINRIKGAQWMRSIAQQQIQRYENKLNSIKSAAKKLLELHSAEQEGMSGGQPTPEMWYKAVDKLSDLVH